VAGSCESDNEPSGSIKFLSNFATGGFSRITQPDRVSYVPFRYHVYPSVWDLGSAQEISNKFSYSLKGGLPVEVKVL
jgi:hypothetical protein